ncbi:MAG: peptide transporter, partial [Verrucomicrobia bacterium]
DWNPISSAFVVTIFILAGIGLNSPIEGLMCASIVLIACSEGGDMQQDRSTGWRLGTNRVVQFRYQVIGIAMGAVLAVALAKVFMNAYPVLKANQYANPGVAGAQWQSTMTYKFVGALRGITGRNPHVMTAMWMGIGLGVLIEVARKLMKKSEGFQKFAKGSRAGFVVEFFLDSVLIASPYASSFGGFAELPTIWWWAAGGVAGSLYATLEEKLKPAAKPGEVELPSDMSTVSLVGGGLIAGEALASLGVGIFLLIQSGALGKIFGG